MALGEPQKRSDSVSVDFLPNQNRCGGFDGRFIGPVLSYTMPLTDKSATLLADDLVSSFPCIGTRASGPADFRLIDSADRSTLHLRVLYDHSTAEPETRRSGRIRVG